MKERVVEVGDEEVGTNKKEMVFFSWQSVNPPYALTEEIAFLWRT